ncbi:TIGR03619 family F420-dependent LLM class oxidoreductase [Nonomuraea sp. NBC_00507]|uniref:TIGR03619 family F420-dependent LLM class oxidoreductase n=1 Tax=Nonomuraea sp. NBC_00507 TaxID=2976002 RepID=UPI002E188E40
MRIGFAVPQYGAFADPKFIGGASARLEEMGYDSLWTADRILAPLTPSDPYPGGDGTMPPAFATFFDPLAALTLAAVNTCEVRLGTSTLNALWQPPVLLARSLASLDLLSGGRLDVGIGLGWLRDEYTATGVPWEGRGARLEEALDVMEAVWTEDVVEHKGALWTVPPSHVRLKPAQRPRPPVLLAGFTPAALERVGRRADGWLGVALPPSDLRNAWGMVLGAAERAGRDPSELRMVVRVNPAIVAEAAAPVQVPHVGTVDQVVEYLRAVAEVGADEALVDVQASARSREDLLELAESVITGLRAS